MLSALPHGTVEHVAAVRPEARASKPGLQFWPRANSNAEAQGIDAEVRCSAPLSRTCPLVRQVQIAADIAAAACRLSAVRPRCR